jgi:hypothetical protein
MATCPSYRRASGYVLCLAKGDSTQAVHYDLSYVLLRGDGPPCPRAASHGGGGINSIVIGRAG